MENIQLSQYWTLTMSYNVYYINMRPHMQTQASNYLVFYVFDALCNLVLRTNVQVIVPLRRVLMKLI